MSKFINEKVFIIIDDADITNEIINKSTSRNKEMAPTKTVDGVTKIILEFNEFNVPSSLDSYEWYCKNTINSVWDAL